MVTFKEKIPIRTGLALAQSGILRDFYMVLAIDLENEDSVRLLGFTKNPEGWITQMVEASEALNDMTVSNVSAKEFNYEDVLSRTKIKAVRIKETQIEDQLFTKLSDLNIAFKEAYLD